MSDYIKRQDALDLLHDSSNAYGTFTVERSIYLTARQKIKNMTAAAVREDIQGEWLKYFHSYFGRHQCVCSNCKNDDYWKKYFCYGNEKFCPNCGARMTGESENAVD